MPYAFTDLQLPAQLELLPERGKIQFENIPVGMCSNSFTFGLGSFGFPMFNKEDITATNMTFWCKAASGSMRVAVWDAVGTLIGLSELFTPTLGFNTVSLIGNAMLIGGNMVYVGFYSNDTTSTLSLVGNDTAFTNVPSVPYPCIFAAGDVDQTMTAYSTYNKRPWIAIGT